MIEFVMDVVTEWVINDTNVDPKYINSEFMHMRYVCIHVAVADTNANIVTF